MRLDDARAPDRCLIPGWRDRDAANRPLIRFDAEWTLRHSLETDEGLAYHEVAP